MNEQTKLLESATRKKIDLILNNLGWNTNEESPKCNVFTERAKTIAQNKKFLGKKPDYLLYERDTDKILAVIEAKRPDRSMTKALRQAIDSYAKPLSIPIVFVTDGTIVRTYHINDKNELRRDGIPISTLIGPIELTKFKWRSEILSTKEVKYTKYELIKIFARANDLLRKDGLREGTERFTEFANLLFMKMINEIEDDREKNNQPRQFDKRYCWDYFKDWDGQRILDYINDTILPKLIGRYNHSGDVFQEKLGIKNPSTIKEIVDKLSKLNLSIIESDVKGDAFEYFLKESVTVGNDLGEYFTPRHIVKIITKLVNPKFGDTIYDPTCGTGGFLIEAYKQLWNKCKHTKNNVAVLQDHTLFGRELTATAKIAKMNMILTGDGHTNIKQMDTLSKPIKNKFDIVLTNFPFSQKTDFSSLYGFNSTDANPIFLKHIIDSLKNGGVAGVVTFQGLLYDNKASYKKIREYLLKNCDVKAVIKLHNYVFQPYTGVNTSILIFKKGKPTEKVWFFDVEEDGFKKTASKRGRTPIGKNDLKLLEDIWDTKENSARSWTVYMSQIQKHNYNLNAETYRPKIITRSKTKIVPLLSVSKLVKDTVKPFTNKRFYLKTGDLKNCFIKSFGTVSYDNKPSRANLNVKENDIIFAKMKEANKSLIIDSKTKELIVSTGFFVLRPNPKIINPRFLWYLVSSKKFLDEKDRLSHGSTQKAINEKNDLPTLNIPLPSLEVQEQLVRRLDKHMDLLIKAYNIEQQIFGKGFDDIYFSEGVNMPLRNVVINTQYGTSRKASSNRSVGIPILRMNNITYEGLINTNDLKYISLNKAEAKTYLLEKGDVLFNRTNSVDLVGKTTLFSFNNAMTFASYLIRLKVDKTKVLPEYVTYYLNSHKMKHKLKQIAKPSVNMANINAKEVISLEIPVPSLIKQRETVGVLKRQLATLDHIRNLKMNSNIAIQRIINSIW